MKCSWKPLASGLIAAVVTDFESELYIAKPDEFWLKVTTELPVGCYTVITRTLSPVPEQCMLKLMALPGLQGMELPWKEQNSMLQTFSALDALFS